MSDKPKLIRVLDADPELGYKLGDDELALARRYLVAEVVQIEPGPWPSARSQRDSGALGYLVVDGLLKRSFELATSASAELLGQGDILRPWQEDSEWDVAHFHVDWEVLEPTRLAVLDRRFVTAACRWPEVMDLVLARCVHRSRSLAFNLALSHLTRVDVRLVTLFWHLADRWGRVSPHGVVLPLRLTHQTLARLVGAQRPSVTTALGTLAQAGRVTRRSDGSWLLHGEAPAELRPAGTEDEALASAG